MMNAIYPKTSVPKHKVACGMVNHAKKKEAKMTNAKTFKRNRNVSKHQVVNGTLEIKYAKKKVEMMNAIYPKTSVPKKMVACGMVNHAKKKEAKMMNAKTFKRNRNVSKH